MPEIKENSKELNNNTLSREECIRRWHEAGIEARKRNKEKRDAERIEHEKWLEEHPEEAEKEKEREREKRRKTHVRRRGRPKKRGPKKKRRYVPKKKKERRKVYCDYKIVGVLNGRQNEYIGQFISIEDAYGCFHALEKSNDEVIFRRKVINAGSLKDSRDEYLLLQKNRNGDLQNTKLRNEYGKLVEHITNHPKWVVYDKCERFVEETFWVYGHCPKTDRKTFKWIFDNMIVGGLVRDYDIERILIYKNKIIIKYDDGNMGIVICKNTSDAMRFYDLLQTWCKKMRQIFFLGFFDKISDRRRELENELIEYTGWSKVKIQRDSTRA